MYGCGGGGGVLIVLYCCWSFILVVAVVVMELDNNERRRFLVTGVVVMVAIVVFVLLDIEAASVAVNNMVSVVSVTAVLPVVFYHCHPYHECYFVSAFSSAAAAVVIEYDDSL